jgi:adenine C2-methylase RlmN of 23S rRNA A2503 and tRNA A37
VNLAFSLHSPFEEERNRLVPINKTHPFPQVLEEFLASQETTIMRGNSITTKLENIFCRTLNRTALRCV